MTDLSVLQEINAHPFKEYTASDFNIPIVEASYILNKLTREDKISRYVDDSQAYYQSKRPLIQAIQNFIRKKERG